MMLLLKAKLGLLFIKINNYMGIFSKFVKNKEKNEQNRVKIVQDVSKQIQDIVVANNLNAFELADLSRWLSDWSVRTLIDVIKKLDKKE